MLAAHAGEDSAAFQIEQDLLEKFARHARLHGDFGDHHRLANRPAGEQEERMKGVTRFLRQHVPIFHRLYRV